MEPLISFLENPLVAIFVVILISGGLGGYVGFLIAEQRSDGAIGEGSIWWKHVTIGIGAAFMVPLFLNMISSGLLDAIRGTPPKHGDPSQLFVLAGFCLVAGVSSRTFIRTLSENILQEARRASAEAREATQAVKEVKSKVGPAIESANAAVEIIGNQALQEVRPPFAVVKLFEGVQSAIISLNAPEIRAERESIEGLLSEDTAEMDLARKRHFYAALWAWVGPLTQLADRIEDPRIWARNVMVETLLANLERSNDADHIKKRLLQWLQAHRALRNRGWSTFNTLNDVRENGLIEAINAGRLLLIRAEQAIRSAAT